MPDKPRKPVDRRGFFRQLMLGALDKAEASSKQVGATIADALRSAQEATEKKRLEEEAQKAAKAPPSSHPVPTDAPLIRRPDNRISRGSYSDAPEPLPLSFPPAEGPGQRSTRTLRPPGALSEDTFQSTCSRCGTCASVCPASCIILDIRPPLPQGEARDQDAESHSQPSPADFPHIIARESACTACASVACANACPTGALTPLHHVSQISLGLAVVHFPTCLRTPSAASGGQDCRQCIAPCPIGESAIGLDPQGRIEVRPGCIGCGLCEQSCPTDPTSIYVDPALAPERLHNTEQP